LSDVPADLADGDDDTTYTAGTGLSLTGTTFSVDTVAIQRRVTGSCAGGQAIRAIGGDGTVTCETLGVQSHDHWGETWSGSGIGLTLNSSNQDALRIVGGDDGIQVESAIDDGVFISSAGEDGILVDSPGRDGASVVNPGGDGFYVRDAGDDGLDVVSAAGNGVAVDRAENDGVRVDSAGHSGVRVNSAGWDGVWVREAGQAGVLVQSTGGVGVAVDFTGTDGFRVCATGDRLGCTPDSTRSNGLEVGNAQHDGVRVIEAGNDGVYANTSRADHEWGFYTPDRIYAGTTLVTTGPLMMVAQSAGVGPLEPGDVVAASGPAQPFAGGPDPVPLARRADAGSGAGVIGVVFSRFVAEEELYESEGEAGVERHPYYQAHSAAGPVGPGEYMLIVVLGVAQVKVDASAGDIRPGQRLTASELAGHARALRTERMNGMLVSEGAAVVGVALAASGSGDDTIPVFVTLR